MVLVIKKLRKTGSCNQETEGKGLLLARNWEKNVPVIKKTEVKGLLLSGN